jgi:hypothetical protein
LNDDTAVGAFGELFHGNPRAAEKSGTPIKAGHLASASLSANRLMNYWQDGPSDAR